MLAILTWIGIIGFGATSPLQAEGLMITLVGILIFSIYYTSAK